MKRGRLFTVFALALFMLLWTAGPTKGPSAVMPQDISLGNHAAPSASFYVKPIWDSIYCAVIPAGFNAILLISLIWMLNKKRIHGRIASP